MSRIFLSHSSKNNDSAVALRDWLLAQGWDDVFLDLDPQRGIAAGGRWERTLNQAAQRCEAVLFLVSRAWLASDWCLKEFNLAHRLNKRLFGLLIDDIPVNDLPVTLTGTWQLVSLASGRDHVMLRASVPGTQDEVHVTFSQEGLTRLRIGLERAGLDARFFAWPPENDSTRPAYRGLLPLEAADAGIFFGREAPTIEAMDRIRGIKDGPAPRLLVLLGASGAGKSSFLRAGLLPRLGRDDRNYLVLPVIRPERAAINGETGLLRSLEVTFADHGIVMPRADIRKAIASGAAALRPLLQTLIERARDSLVAEDAQTGPPLLVLAIDQGEELFLIDGASESATLLDLLRELLVDDALALIVVITIRSDAYEQLQTAKGLEGITQQPLSLIPMPRGAYQAVIEGPAARLKETGRSLVIEPALTQALLSDIEDGGGSDALPLLAFTLERLYLEYGARGRLTLADYNALGRIRGSIEAAVERAFRAADSDPRIPRDHEARNTLLRHGLIPWLAGINPDTGSPRRQKARISEIPEQAHPLIALLVEQRLLSTDVDSDTGERTIEPAHESLLRQWGSLQGWLHEDFAALTNLESIKRATRDWTANAKGEDWLSHRAGRLEDAGRLLQRPDLAANLDATDRAYLTACNAREETERKEKAAVLERKLRLQRQLSVVASIVAFAMTAIGLVAYAQKYKADAATEVAQAQRTVAQTQTTLARDNESRALAALSDVAAKEGSFTESINLALAAWPRDQTDRRPPLEVTLQSLGAALSSQIPVLGEYPHKGDVLGVLLTRDGKHILSWSSDNSLRLWDVTTGSQIGQTMTHEGVIYGAKLTRDETRILSWSADGTVKLWDVATGRQIGPAMHHDDQVRSALLVKDETCILSLSGKSLRLWDVATGRQIGPTMQHDDEIFDVEMARDETRILSWSKDRTLRQWDVAKGRQIGPAMRHDGLVNRGILLRDGARILSWSADGTIRLWDAMTGLQVGPAMQHDGPVSRALLTGDETRVLSWSGKSLRLWDLATGQQIAQTMLHDSFVKGALLTRDATRIVSWSDDHTLRVWDVATGGQLGPAMRHDLSVSRALLTRDETRIVSWSEDKTIRIWDLATGHQIGPAMAHDDEIYGLKLIQDETRILSWSADGTLRLWDVATGNKVGPTMQHRDPVSQAVLNREETRILSVSGKSVRLWDVATGEQFGPTMLHDGIVNGTLLNRNKTRILSWSEDKTVRLWDLATGHQIGSAMQHDDSVSGAVLSRNENHILSWSGNTLRLWDVATSRQIGPAKRHDAEVGGALLTRDDARILSWSADGTIRLWDAMTGLQIGPAMRHDGPVSRALLTTDETRVLSWSGKSLRLWDLATGQQIGQTMLHDRFINGAVLTKDDTRLLSWSDDHTLRLWSTTTGQLIGPAIQHAGAVLGAKLIHDETRILSWSADGTLRQWDVATGQQVGPTMQHDEELYEARLTKDESGVLSGSGKSLRLWDLTTGLQIGPTIFHAGVLMGPPLTRDGTRALTSSGEGLRLWDLATGQQIGPVMQQGSSIGGTQLIQDETRVLSWSGKSLRVWDISWRGRNLMEIACNHSPPDHDLSEVTTRYGVKIIDPICEPGKSIPVPGWSSVEPKAIN